MGLFEGLLLFAAGMFAIAFASLIIRLHNSEPNWKKRLVLASCCVATGLAALYIAGEISKASG